MGSLMQFAFNPVTVIDLEIHSLSNYDTLIV